MLSGRRGSGVLRVAADATCLELYSVGKQFGLAAKEFCRLGEEFGRLGKESG
ncbi:hypothetical protein [Candidatus Electronema sp. PJ]|uniref:hypothetical protein n=1 Tax=Candidatus Electronema sp. PJ TaxID=3401572 RepID=UPI003AA86FC5